MNNIFSDKTLKAFYLSNGIKSVLSTCKPFNSNSIKAAENLFSNVATYIVNHDSMNKLITYMSVLESFAKYGINNGSDLINAIIDSKDYLKKNFYAVEKIKIKKLAAHNGFKTISKKSHVGLCPERTVVIRSKYGNYPILFYENFKGAMTDFAQLNLLKQDYHYATGCNYYQTRPILLSTWLTLDPIRQNCTCIVDKQD